MEGYGWKVERREAGILPKISGLMLFTFLILGVLTPLPIAAQTESTGAISGTVRDQSGLPVPKVLIKITLKNTDAVREVLSDEEGSYTANLLTPGTYSGARGAERFPDCCARSCYCPGHGAYNGGC